jgi:hypothetical protein
MSREEQVRFQVEGQWLYGMLHLPEATRRVPGIIMVHGFTGQRIEAHRLFVRAARTLAAAGIAALRFDCRGSGESEGEFVDMTVSGEIADARAALGFLAARPEVDPERLGVLGLSLGGAVAACLAGSDPRVKALALWTPVAYLMGLAGPGVIPPGAEQQLATLGWVDLGGNRVGRAFVEELPSIRPLEAVQGYCGPALLVYGTCDQALSPEHTQGYLQALPGPTEYVTIEGADHVFSSYPWETQAIEATVRWLTAAL